MRAAHRIILQLLYRSNHRLLKLSFILFPVALYISMSSYLFIDTLLRSYETHLSQSYLGYQGRLSVTSDAKTIRSIADYARKKSYIFSPRIDLKQNLVIKGDTNIVKYTKMILLSQNYLDKKFKHAKSKDLHLYMNGVLANNLGAKNTASIKGLHFDDLNVTLDIYSSSVIDTGFLSSEPIVFLPLESMEKIFPNLDKRSYLTLEFYEKKNSTIKEIKEGIARVSKASKSMRVTIHDLLLDTKEHREFFQKMSLLKNIIIFFIFIFVLAIVLVSIALLVRFKYQSLRVLHFLGMSHFDLSLSITAMVSFVVVLMSTLAFVSLGIWQELFLMVTTFSKSFFQSIDTVTLMMTFGSGLVIITITFVFSLITFKGASQ